MKKNLFVVAIAALILILGQMGHVYVNSAYAVGSSASGLAGNQQYSWFGSGSGSGSGLTLASLASQRGFQKVSEDGFGSRHNSYAWSSAWFKGKLYVGTNRDMLCYLSVVFGTDASLLADADCESPDYRGEIWAYDPEGGGAWKRVYQSPLATPASGGAAVPRDQGYRGMLAVVEPDGTEALYIGGYTSKEVLPVNLPARLLRSVDGENFTELRSSDSSTLGNADTFGLRSFTQYKGKLYMTANMNPPQRPRLLEADLATVAVSGASGTGTFDVRQVNPSAVQPFELEVFNNYLYVGTIDTQNGFSVLKTDCTGAAPYTFLPVVTHGAYRKDRSGQESYNLNEYVLSMCVFQDRLYIGSGCGLGGYDFVAKVGPAPAELIRIDKNDNWQLVCGKKRTTPDGIKVPLSRLTAGMGNPFSGYFWRMAVHRDWLYVATMDSSIALRNPDIMSLLDPNKITPNGDYTQAIQLVQMGLGLAGLTGLSPFDGGSQNLIDKVGDNIVNILGGFDLWKTRNGVQWYPVTTTGFGDKFNIGARILVSSPVGLFVGTANPYYGAQVWLGDDHFPFARNLQAEPTGTGGSGSDGEQGTVKLRWTVPADIAAASETDVVSHIYRRQVLGKLGSSGDLFLGLLGEDKAGLRGLTEVAATTKQYYIDANVVEGTTYLYQVSCETGDGELSDRSNVSLCRVPDSAAQIFTQRPRPDRKQGQYTQAVTLFNTTDAPLFSTLYYILEGLSTNTTLLNRSGTAENGSPYLQVPLGREGLLPGQRLQFQLRFSSPGTSRFNYIPFVNTDTVEP